MSSAIPSPLRGEGQGGGVRRSRINFARKLRTELTEAERHLWRSLRLKQLNGYRFRRQHPIGPYIADFICLEAKLILEVDGGQHAISATDVKRDQWLLAEGYEVLRFWNHQVLAETEAVLEKILDKLRSITPTLTLPPQTGGGK